MCKLKDRGRAFASAAFLLALGFPSLRADDTAYFINSSGLFGIIDLDTGAFTMLGTSVIPSYAIVGLGTVGGKLYTAPYTGSTLYSVSPASGALNPIGSSSIQFWGLGSTTTGLYALGAPANGSFSLYSLDPATAAATLIGPLGMGIAQFYAWSLSTGSSTLYLADNENLYSINTSTGVATLIGSNNMIPGALVYENGKLYAGADSCNPPCNISVWTLNTASGAGTFVANAGTSGPGTGGSATNFAGLAPIPLTTPLPAGPTYVIAHFPFGGGWSSRVMIGAGSTAANVSVTFFSQTGTVDAVPLEGQGNQNAQQFQLAPNAVQVMAADPAERNAGPLQVAWALAASSAPLNVFTLFDYAPSAAPTTKPATQIQGSVGAQSLAAANSFHFPISVYGPLSFNAGLAIANPNNSSTTYTVVVLNPDGSQRASVQQPALVASGQSIFLITDLFGPGVIPQDLTNPFNGSVVVCASQPVGLVAIGVEGNAFFTIPTTKDYPCP